MRAKMTLAIVLAASSLVLVALPAEALAGEPKFDPASGKSPLSFSGVNGGMVLTSAAGPEITCKKGKDVGAFTLPPLGQTGSSTGDITLTFEECREGPPFNTQCNTVTQGAGTVVFGKSIFHTTYLTDAKTTPGILITPPTGGVFAKIICMSGMTVVEVKGNGVIGHMNAPKCGAQSGFFENSFTASGAVQTYKTLTETGVNGTWNLQTLTNGKAAVEASLTSTMTHTFVGDLGTLTCT